MRTSTFRLALAAVLSTGAIAMATRTGVAAPGPTRGPLVMTSFVQQGRTDVRRNEMLQFKFSVQLNKRTVDDRSLRVDATTTSGTKPAIGARVVRGNLVAFDPQRTQRNYNDSKRRDTTITEKDHPEGFDAYQDYEITIAATPDLHILKSVQRAPNLLFYSSTFRTNATYDDPVSGQPYFYGDHGTGLLGFDPPRSGATGLVDEDALVVLEFNEPINIDTLDPSSTIIVTRITVGEQVPGYVKQDPSERSGRRFLFVPSVGFGSDLANLQGWDIQITLGAGITDLAGNPLRRPVIFPVFRTRYAPGKPSCSLITETFNNQTKMDTQTVALGGEWNTVEKGVLRGGCAAVPSGSRAQMMYVPADVGAAAAVVGVGWGPSSNATFAATHPEIILNMGHTSLQTLGSDFVGNVNIGTPQQVFKGQYTVQQAKNINPPGLDNGYWDWPTFTSPFEWNGVNNLVFDAACAGANNCQILRIGFIPAAVAFPNRRAVSRNYKDTTASFSIDSVVYDIRFKKRRRTTQAVSLWYELASDKPIFAAPILSPVGQAGGVGVLLEVEGANGKPDPFNIGGFIADPTTGTGFTPNASEIDGHRFFRFRVSMFANLSTNQTARATSVQFPYCF